MPLILAVDRDRRQVNQLVSLVHKRLNAELVQASSAAEGLEALAGRVPDLILTSSLLSPKDDGVLAGHLRELGPLASHVQTLTIPVLKSSRPRRSKSGSVLSKLRRDNTKTVSTLEGCDPEVFAEEISLYLARAAEEQEMKAAQQEKTSSRAATTEAPASPEGLEEFEADESPAIDDAIRADAVANVDAPLPSLDLAYDETIRAAEAFGYAPAEAEGSDEMALELPQPAIEEVPAYETELGATSHSESDVAADFPPTPEAPARLAEARFAREGGSSDQVELRPKATIEETQPTEEHEEQDASAIPIDRLVALFADLEPRSIEVMEPRAEVASIEAADDEEPIVAETMAETVTAVEPEELAEPAAVAVTDAPHAATTDSPASEPPADRVLDEEALVLLGEAAWKATFRAGLMKDLGLTSEGKKPAAAASNDADRRQSSSPSKIEATTPREEPKSEEAAAEPATPEARKESRGKKKKDSRSKTKAPVQDEWGLFDPDQCGFSALVKKLDTVTEEPEEQRPRNGTRVRVISYSNSLPRS